MLSQGYSPSEIAKKMGISVDWVLDEEQKLLDNTDDDCYDMAL